jgi:tRNA pseudouridine55 synthase
VDKPGGITSHGVVAQARRRLGVRKIGHAGTLDPMATGVMVLGVGRATRMLGHLALADKTYEATIRLGVSTVTDDAEGDTTDAPGAAGLTASSLEEAVAGFVGEISQVPSAVSAIKVDGRRAYAMVRRGEDVELAPRSVTVSRFDILDVRPATQDGVEVVDVDVVVDCSTGTYVRALARDLGASLGTGGHLTALRRTRVGGFTLEHASDELVPLDAAARLCFPVVEISDADFADAVHGRPVPVRIDAEPTALLHGDTVVGLYRPDGDLARPIAVLVEPG